MCMAMLLEMFLRSARVLPGLLAGETLPLFDQGNQGDWTLVGSVSDEFNGGTLNFRKWNNLCEDGDHHGQWKGRVPSQYNRENIFSTNASQGKLVFVGHFELVGSPLLKNRIFS